MTSLSLIAQTYQDHFGTGNNVGIRVQSSPTQNLDSAALTLNGTGFFPDLAGASRFLAQAGFGGSYEDIEYVTQIGIEPWIEEQFELPYTTYLDEYYGKYQEVSDLIHTQLPGIPIDRRREYTDFVFWEKVFKGSDVLRNKAAFALHQILVMSTRTIKHHKKGFGGADFYDILYEGAFGNFRDILSQVTLHPMMGSYLSHFQNQKSDPSKGTLPDENYAREIMQLFTIGLWELNNDGTYKTDDSGERIPTYTNEDITELAKVFTGLSGAEYDLEANPDLVGEELVFWRGFSKYKATIPMIMWEDRHEQGEKVMLDGTVIPDGQTGMEDIQDALDILFNHPNVGPFISYRLIQHLVKSNPSPAYVNRVATVFNNNGQGIRGDLKAVFKAILTDTEARDCLIIEEASTGKLRQPIERLAILGKVFDVDSPSGRLWFSDYNNLSDELEQTFQGAPSVFNFFVPSYAEDEYVAPNGMVSPEFQILHSVSSIHYLNTIEDAIKDKPFRNFTSVNTNNGRLSNNNADAPFLDFSDEIGVLDNEGVSALLDRLDLILCHGELTDNTRSIIEDALMQVINSNVNHTSQDIVEQAIYYIMVTADFTILR